MYVKFTDVSQRGRENGNLDSSARVSQRVTPKKLGTFGSSEGAASTSGIASQTASADGDETIPETPDAKKNLSNEGAVATEIANSVEKQTSSLAADACDNDMRGEELSPHLTNLIISGVVPESPIEERGKSRNKFVIRGCISPVHLQEQQVAAAELQEKKTIRARWRRWRCGAKAKG
ncbi:hypothetical protein RYX36_019918 [Vicia faba]